MVKKILVAISTMIILISCSVPFIVSAAYEPNPPSNNRNYNNIIENYPYYFGWYGYNSTNDNTYYNGAFFQIEPTMYYNSIGDFYYFFVGDNATKFLSMRANLNVEQNSNDARSNTNYYIYLNGTMSQYGTSDNYRSDPDFTNPNYTANGTKMSGINSNFVPKFDESVPDDVRNLWENEYIPDDYYDDVHISDKFSYFITPRLGQNMKEFESFDVTISARANIYVCLEVLQDINPNHMLSWYKFYYPGSAEEYASNRSKLLYRHKNLEKRYASDDDINNDISTGSYFYNLNMLIKKNETKTYNIKLENIKNLEKSELYHFFIWAQDGDKIGSGSNAGPINFPYYNSFPFSLDFDPPDYVIPVFGDFLEGDNISKDEQGNIIDPDLNFNANDLSLKNLKNLIKTSSNGLMFFTEIFSVFPVEIWGIVAVGITVIVVIGIVRIFVG